MTDSSNHPTLDRLDAVRTGEGTADDTAHVASCSLCQAILSDLRAIALDLRRSQPDIEIPAAVDQRVLWLARKQAALIKRGRVPATRWAIAASLLLAVGAAALWQWMATPPTAIARRDVDGNGRVDILDAFALARTLKAESTANNRWDVDADGNVDTRDVDLIAHAAVALGNS